MATAAAAWYASDSLRHRREKGEGYAVPDEEVDVGSESFLRAAEALTAAPISWGDHVELLINGDRIFPAYLETIAGAQRSLNLLTYAYWRGDITHDVARALCDKARAGVEVNVLLDAVGSMQMKPGLVGSLERAGATVARFRPPKPYALKRIANRNHRKILVADGSLGMIGGVGIAEEWTGDAQDPGHWRDTHLRVRGPVVRGLQGAFAESWLEATGRVLIGEAHLPELEPTAGGGPMQLVRSRAGVGDTNVEALYFLAIACARHTLDLTAAYFAPRRAFIDALVDARKRGVAIRILIPGPHIDKPVVRVAGRASYEELLEAGVEIFEYQPTMLHAKVLVVDGAWSSVGSVNFDNRSFQLHDEATLCVQSEELAAQLTESFEADLQVSERMLLSRWNDRPLRHRAQERALALVRREL
ncbi:MAG: phospholipase D-like domain-containing protein [Actinomycetota bacterium]|nr:phospholipase D-like domain-containing protein [Actinomycetota bacterium]